MSRKEYPVSFIIGASIDGSYNKSFQAANAELESMQNEIAALSKTQGDISSFQKQQKALEDSKAKLTLLKQQYDNIQKEMEETGNYSSTLANKLLDKEAQIKKTTEKIEEQTSSLDRMGEELRQAGVNTDNLTNESNELAAELAELKQKQVDVGNSSKKMGGATVNAFEEIQSAAAAAGLIKLFDELKDGIVDASKASIEFESDATGVFKTIDGTEEQLGEITEGIKDMATEIPATTTEIAGVTEAAGQLGIARDDVLDFTRVMIDLGESTNLTADEAASSLAKFANITRTSSKNYSRLGSVIVDLGNNLATTEADIVAMSTRLASAGTLAGFTEPQIMALAAAMSSVGIEAEAGGTAMTQTMSGIEMAVAEGGEALEKYASVANMSAEEFAQAWETNAIYALQSFIAGIGSLEDKGESAVLVLDELGLTGIRQSNMIKSLGLAADTLASSIDIANNAWVENNALSNEAGKRYSTTESRLSMLGNSYNNLKIAIGDVYAPALNRAIDLGMDMLEGITEFVEENPTVVRGITAVATGVGAATVVIGGVVVATKAWTAAQKLLNIELLKNPATLAITAIVGLTTAIVTFAATAEESSEKLSASSEAQYKEVKALEEEYKVLCKTMPETSAEAQLLKREIDEATEAFENNKQTAKELAEEHRQLMEEHKEFVEAYEDSNEEFQKNEDNTLGLMLKLEELTSIENKSAESKAQILTIVEMLNEAIPELGLNYDSVTDSMNLTAEKIREIIEAEIALDKFEKNKSNLKTAISQEQGLYTNWQKQKDETAAAQKAYDDAMAAMKAADEAYTKPKSGGEAEGRAYASYISSYAEAVRRTSADLEDATTKEEEAKQAYEENQSIISSLTDEIVEYGASVEENSNSISGRINSAIADINTLKAAYGEAYESALESVTGQYSLWEKADTVVATSVSSINANIESQTTYWQNYNSNLDTLASKTSSIEGLGQMISSFADGSPESVNMIAGMATATDEQLSQMVANWQELNSSELAVSESLALIVTDFDNSVNDIVTDIEEGVSEMELSEEAAASAKSTMDAYITELEAGGILAVEQAQDIRDRIQAALTGATAPSVPTTADASNEPTNVDGYAGGTDYATPGLHWVGENGPELLMFGGGEKVLSAEESAAFADGIRSVTMLSPNLLLQEAIAEKSISDSQVLSDNSHASKAPVSIQVTFQIEGNATEETLASLDSYGEEFAERVLSVIESANSDSIRRSYN